MPSNSSTSTYLQSSRSMNKTTDRTAMPAATCRLIGMLAATAVLPAHLTPPRRTSPPFYLSVKNIANEAYIVARRPAGVRPGLPRTVLGGVKISP